MVSFVSRARRLRALTVVGLLASVLVTLPAAAPAATSDLILSEVIEGSSLNKAVEIYNGTGGAVDLTDYTLEVYFNGSASAGTTVALAGTVADGDVFVVADDGAAAAILAVTDQTTTASLFNGDDAIVLRKAGTVVDAFGQVGVDPGSQWPGGGQDDTLQRNPDVCAGDTDETDPFDASLQWAVLPTDTFDGLGNHTADCDGGGTAVLVINEVDYDQASTDTAEFVELKNTGTAPAELAGWTLELVNGTGGGAAVYDTIALPDVSLGAGEYYVVCANAATVAECDLDDGPDTNFIQNGAPDAIGLRAPDATLVDALSYEGDSGAPYVEGSGSGLVDDPDVTDAGLSRCDDGADTDQNNVDFTFTGITPGATNACEAPQPAVIINEVDADTPSTDVAEFIELYDGGAGSTDLTGLVLVLFNGSDDASYEAFDLDGLSTGPDGYFVLCVDPANVAGCDLDGPGSDNLVQNGADAVALFEGDAADFPNDTPVTTEGLLDALVYDTNDGDDAGLLPLLNPGQPQVNEGGGAGGSANDSNQRCPDGSGGARNTDTYAQFAPSPGEENVCAIVIPPLTCDGSFAFTKIHTIQGAGATTPIAGTEVYVEGVVVGDFQASNTDGTDLAGFYVQEEDTDVDGDSATSEGIFVFDLFSPVEVAAGDQVRLRGVAGEFQDQTQLNVNNGEVVVCAADQGGLVSTTPIPFPLVDGQAGLERYEGMAVSVAEPMTVIEYFNLDRYGIVDVATERLENPTDAVAPGAPAAAYAAENETKRIRLDDGNQDQNIHPVTLPDGQLEFADAFGGGDTLSGIEGVLSWIRPRVGGTPDRYAIQLTSLPTFADANPRPVGPPTVGGTLEIAGFNVLNYFNGDGLGGGFPTPRGATTPAELVKQTAKIVSAITGMDAAVVGLLEIENDFADGSDSAIADLVDALNAAAGPGTYAYIDPGANVGIDEIAVALIYQPAVVTPVGDLAILDDPAFVNPFGADDDRNRPALAQTFMEVATGEHVTAVVNHFKSKSGSELDDAGAVCVDADPGNDVPDCDQGDGQGYFNATRTAAATELVAWLAGAPTGTTDPDYLLVGDYNAYAQEDPIVVLETAGYVDLLEAFQPADVYTYVFDGQTGYLDYGLASTSLYAQVTGTAPWNINADEPDAFDYDEAFDDPLNLPLWYHPSEFRSSDHDPVIVGLGLDAVAGVATATPDTLWPPNHKYRTVEVTAVDAAGDPLTVEIVSVTSSEPDAGLDEEDRPNDIVIVGPSTVRLRAERYAIEGRTYTITALVTAASGQVQLVTTTVYVPHDQRP